MKEDGLVLVFDKMSHVTSILKTILSPFVVIVADDEMRNTLRYDLETFAWIPRNPVQHRV